MESHGKKSNSSTANEQLNMHDLSFNILFFSFHCMLDVVVLILHMDDLKYNVAKLAIDSIITILLLSFHTRVNHQHINIFFTITKLTTIMIIFIIGYDVILLIVFVTSISTEQKKEYIIQRMITKIGALIVTIITSSILEIIITLFILLLEWCQSRMNNFYAIFKAEPLENTPLLVIKKIVGSIKYKIYLQESLYFPPEIQKLFLQTKYVFSISIKNVQILNNWKNQFLTNYFFKQGDVCVQFYLDEEHGLNTTTFQKVINEPEKHPLLTADSKNTLRFILTTQLESTQKYNTHSLTKALELYCQQILESGTQWFYNCFLNINFEESEIQLIIVDITQYHHFQVDMIQDQFKTQIVQSFSHELRTPLNSACNFLQCCLSDRNVNKETKQKLIKPAYNALRLQSHLINDIIDFNCLFVHDIELEFKEFYIKDLIDEVNQLFKSSIEMKKLALYVDLQENTLPRLTTDFSRLMQIIVNILQNAIKYSNSGIIILKLSNFSDEKLKFTIKDEGVGISGDQFYQIQQMLTIIETKSGLNKYKKWHGFGLLISQMLLSKLCPKDFKSLLIRSGGRDKGTKVSFYIKNHTNTVSNSSSSGYNIKNTLRQISKLKVSFQSITKQLSINGTMIQISDMMASYRNLNWMKNATIRSNEVSQIADSYLQNEVDQKMNEINHVMPSLITDIGVGAKCKQLTNEVQIVESPQYKSARDNQTSKVLSYKKLKMKDDFDSDNLIKQIFKKRKCTCKRILSVDDEIFNQKSIQCLLSQQGFEVVLAFNGEEAIKVINETERCSHICNLFMLILMDYQMPIMDGIQTTKALCQMMQQKLIPQLYIVGLTAFTSKQDIQTCIEAGMSDVLAKPLKMKEFFEILHLL